MSYKTKWYEFDELKRIANLCSVEGWEIAADEIEDTGTGDTRLGGAYGCNIVRKLDHIPHAVLAAALGVDELW